MGGVHGLCAFARDLLHDGLTAIDPFGAVIPSLARVWSSDSGYRQWRFHLVEGVSASLVAAAFNRLDAVGSVSHRFGEGADLDALRPVWTPFSERAIDCSLAVGLPDFPAVLARGLWRVPGPRVPRFTTGPLRALRSDGGVDVPPLLVPDSQYRGHRQRLPASVVELVAEPDLLRRFDAVSSGRVHIALGLEGSLAPVPPGVTLVYSAPAVAPLLWVLQPTGPGLYDVARALQRSAAGSGVPDLLYGRRYSAGSFGLGSFSERRHAQSCGFARLTRPSLVLSRWARSLDHRVIALATPSLAPVARAVAALLQRASGLLFEIRSAGPSLDDRIVHPPIVIEGIEPHPSSLLAMRRHASLRWSLSGWRSPVARDSLSAAFAQGSAPALDSFRDVFACEPPCFVLAYPHRLDALAPGVRSRYAPLGAFDARSLLASVRLPV